MLVKKALVANFGPCKTYTRKEDESLFRHAFIGYSKCTQYYLVLNSSSELISLYCRKSRLGATSYFVHPSRIRVRKIMKLHGYVTTASTSHYRNVIGSRPAQSVSRKKKNETNTKPQINWLRR